MRASPGVRPARTSHRSAVVLLRPGHGDKVDEFLNTAKQRGFKVAVGTHSGQDPLPPQGDVTLVGVRPPESLEGSVLNVDTTWNVWPPLEANAGGLDGLPDVNERMS